MHTHTIPLHAHTTQYDIASLTHTFTTCIHEAAYYRTHTATTTLLIQVHHTKYDLHAQKYIYTHRTTPCTHSQAIAAHILYVRTLILRKIGVGNSRPLSTRTHTHTHTSSTIFTYDIYSPTIIATKHTHGATNNNNVQPTLSRALSGKTLWEHFITSRTTTFTATHSH